MAERTKAGYLAQIEAERVAVRPGPNVVYVRLIRDFDSEAEHSCMFAELTPGQALRLTAELRSAVTIALAHAD